MIHKTREEFNNDMWAMFSLGFMIGMPCGVIVCILIAKMIF